MANGEPFGSGRRAGNVAARIEWPDLDTPTDVKPRITKACNCCRTPVRRSSEDVMSASDLTLVGTFRSTADAQVAKGILDEMGIESMIRSDNAGGMYPALSGADLLVRAEDVGRANEALSAARRQLE